MNDQHKASIIRALVDGLRGTGRIGKTHVQKAVLFAQEAAGLDLGFRYVIHHYGPYSFDLANFLDVLDRQGVLGISRATDGYGFEVAPGAVLASEPLSSLEKAKVDSLVRELQGMTTSGMELLATAFYVNQRYGNRDPENLSRVRALKPKFSPEEVDRALSRATEITTAVK